MDLDEVAAPDIDRIDQIQEGLFTIGARLPKPIVAAVADAHGGRVWFIETPGGGATFAVELPTKPEPVSISWGADAAMTGESTGDGATATGTGSLAETATPT